MARQQLVLITRPKEGAEELAQLLEARCISTFCEPMLTYRDRPEAMRELAALNASAYAGLIISSRRTLSALMPHTHLKALPLHVVGEKTAEKAREMGFSIITHFPDMARLSAAFNVSRETFLYVRGAHVSTPLRVQTHEIIAYEAEAATALSETLKQHLTQGNISLATFLSARTAQIFQTLAAPLSNQLHTVDAIAFSPQVAEALADAPWCGINVCAEPTLHALVDAVDKRLRRQ